MHNMLDLLKQILAKVRDVAYQQGLIADYVVEYGTSGIWDYEKWASGKAVCWGTTAIAVTSWTTWGYANEGNPHLGRTAFPTGLFVEAPYFNVSVTGPMGLSGTENYLTVTKDETPEIYPLRPGSGTSGTITYHLKAKGKWKLGGG